MENSLIKILESFLFVAVFLAIYWVIGFFCKSTFDFEIRSDKGYTIVVVGGFIFKIVLVKILSGQY